MLKLKGTSLIKRFYFSSDSRTLISIGQNVKYITVWELQKGKIQRKIPMPSYAESGPPEKIEDIAILHPNMLFAWTDNPYLPIRRWNLESDSNTPDTEWVCPFYFLYCKPVSNQSKLLFLGTNEQRTYDPAEKAETTYKFFAPQMLTGTDINFDGTLFSTWRYDQKIILHLTHDPEADPIVINLNSYVDFLRFHPSRSLIAVAFARAVQVFETSTGEPVSPRFPHEKTANQVEFTPDGKRLISVSSDAHIRIWDTTTYEEIVRYDFGIGPLKRLAIAPDGLTFAVANFDKEIVVADLDS